MDTVKIGKYIAGKRKALGMTQAQVAEKLGMSDKSVSKWERGILFLETAAPRSTYTVNADRDEVCFCKCGTIRKGLT